MFEKPSTRVVSDFERIKRIYVPLEDIEEGIRDVCTAICALPYAVTTDGSGDMRELSAEAAPDEGFTLVNYGHMGIAFDEHDQRSYAFIKKLIDLASQFSEIEILPMSAEGHGHPGWARDTTGDSLVSEIGYEVRVKKYDREIDSHEAGARLKEVLAQSNDNTPIDEVQRKVDEVHVRLQQIPKEEAERKISQFREFKEKLTQLAFESAVDN